MQADPITDDHCNGVWHIFIGGFFFRFLALDGFLGKCARLFAVT